MNITRFFSIALTGGALLVASAAMAQTSNPGTTDGEFVPKVAASGQSAVAVARHVQSNASSVDVKELARAVEKDHAQLNTELGDLARTKGISIPTSLSGGPAAERDRLIALSGKDLDREYLSALVADHQNSIDLFRAEARDGRDAEIRSFASATVPKLEHHLQMIQDVQAGKPMMKMGDESDGTVPTAPGERKARNVSGY